MSNKYNLILFDLDGTILDTTEGILRAVNYTIEKYDLPKPEKEVLVSFIGPPIQLSFKKLYGFSDEKVQEMAVAFRDYYSKNENLLKAIPYDGVYELFKYLKSNNYKIGIATYKREDYALKLLKWFHFDDYTDIMFGGDNDNTLKKKDIILKCLEKAGEYDSRKVLMVGDTEHDAKGAKELNMDFLAVTYGFGFKKNADYQKESTLAYVDRVLDIVNYLS